MAIHIKKFDVSWFCYILSDRHYIIGLLCYFMIYAGKLTLTLVWSFHDLVEVISLLQEKKIKSDQMSI